MNLKEWATSQGIAYVTARRQYAAGTLPVPTYRIGRLIMIGEPVGHVRDEAARLLLAECLQAGLPDELAARVRQELAR